MKILFRGKSDRMWDGPVPTKSHQKDTSHWITNHLTQFPGSTILAQAYPQEAATARAIRRYFELEALLFAGEIDEIDYQVELEKILPLIDITDIHELDRPAK